MPDYKIKSLKMNLKVRSLIICLLICLFFNCCNSNTNDKIPGKLKTDTVSVPLSNKVNNAINKSGEREVVADNNLEISKNIYLKIDKIICGTIFTNAKEEDVFYRILEIPDEENITLFVENISIGAEGGKYQLIKRERLTDDNAVLPKFGLNTVDSMKFTDSVTIEGYFNKERIKINLNNLKKD